MDYAGDVTPSQCWRMVSEEPGTLLVDVRTTAEWAYVGGPELPEGEASIVRQQWQVFPHMEVDSEFAARLEEQLAHAGADKETSLCFLCRSGVRSLAAAKAMTQAGYKNSYNIAGGFEGDLDGEGHRGRSNGWKAAGLPWRQK